MKRYRTTDREATPILTTEEIGPKRSKTPEGFLLCEDVPAARTGTMLYGEGETPVKPGKDGIARVERDEKALFDKKTLSSYNGKPVVNEHPDADVNPDNWRHLSVGIVLNPRRGDSENSDVMLVDLLITDAAAIADVESGKREVSAGYEADYEQTGEGTGRQSNIIGNHIALVERGRCGPRCAIGDHQPTSLKEKSTMGTKTVTTTNRARKPIPAAIRKMFLDSMEAMADDPTLMDGAGEADDVGGDGDSHTHIHIHNGGDAPTPADTATEQADTGVTQDDPTEQRLAALEGSVAQILEILQGGGQAPAEDAAPEVNPPADGGGPNDDGNDLDGEGEKENTEDGKMTKDSAALETSFKAVVADAEILVPGFRLPTFDSKAKRAVTVDSMCSMRKRILDHLASTTDGKTLIDNVHGASFDLGKATCADAAVVFRAAAGAKRMLNNSAATHDSKKLPSTPNAAKSTVKTAAELNRLNQEYWAKQGKV